MDLEIQKAAEILFARRLRTYRETLVARGKSSDDSSESSMARGARLSALGQELRTHCLSVVSDYIVLLELFEAAADSGELLQSFKRHVDDVVSELERRFDINGRAEQNRIANQASSVKCLADAELARAIERATKAGRHHGVSNESGPGEVDDRLPLGRRGTFDRELDRIAELAHREEGTLALVMIDIDHFKSVNDEHGHPVGDEVLLEVANAIVNRVAHKGKAYRYGGEEFALLLPSYSTEEAVGLAERLRKDIEGSTVSSKELRVTASFGVASLPDQTTAAKSLLERADAALYRAKTTGRNRVATLEDVPSREV